MQYKYITYLLKFSYSKNNYIVKRKEYKNQRDPCSITQQHNLHTYITYLDKTEKLNWYIIDHTAQHSSINNFHFYCISHSHTGYHL